MLKNLEKPLLLIDADKSQLCKCWNHGVNSLHEQHNEEISSSNETMMCPHSKNMKGNHSVIARILNLTLFIDEVM